MQDVSDKLLGQFMDCLEQRLTAPVEEDVAAHAMVTAPDDVSAHLSPAVGEVPAPLPAPTPAVLPKRDESLNLGATVLPVLLKSYWKQGAVALVLLALLVLLIIAL